MTINERVERRLIGATQVVQPKTILRWQRAGFTTFWRWKSRYAPHGRCPYRGTKPLLLREAVKEAVASVRVGEIAAQGTADMEDHETRRKIIRQWMALPKDKRQTADQAAAFAKRAVEQNKFQRGSREPYDRIMGWLLSRVGRS